MSAQLPSKNQISPVAAELARLSPDYAATPLLDLPRLASELGVAQVLAKYEGRRTLGSFKSLGGTYAGLRALARAAKLDVGALTAQKPSGQPALVCASDGNHGLAVAAAARFAGARARVYLHGGVSQIRARRIEDEGAEVVWVNGTYDDAVDAAAQAAHISSDILVADTTDDPNDQIVRDVMAGYGVIADEVRQQVETEGLARPTHLFVQAGVGGLAAAMAEGLASWLATPASMVVVEPDVAPAVAEALKRGRPFRVQGNLETTAEMLSCGEASAPALAVLMQYRVQSILASEKTLNSALELFRSCGGPGSTSSGCAGLAGVVAARAKGRALPRDARILVIITEREI